MCCTRPGNSTSSVLTAAAVPPVVKLHMRTAVCACETLQDTLAELGILGLVPYLQRRLSPCQHYHQQPQQESAAAASQSPGALQERLGSSMLSSRPNSSSSRADDPGGRGACQSHERSRAHAGRTCQPNPAPPAHCSGCCAHWPGVLRSSHAACALCAVCAAAVAPAGAAYLNYVGLLNQAVMMSTQLYNDATNPAHHKYAAHQVALLYVSVLLGPAAQFFGLMRLLIVHSDWWLGDHGWEVARLPGLCMACTATLWQACSVLVHHHDAPTACHNGRPCAACTRNPALLLARP